MPRDAFRNTDIYTTNNPDRLYVSDGGAICDNVVPVAAAGTGQANGAPLSAGVNVVTAANGTKAVVLPTAEAGMKVVVINTVASHLLWVCPATDAAIDAVAANGAYPVGAGQHATFVAASATQWYTLPAQPST